MFYFLFYSQGLKLGLEETQVFWFVDHFQASRFFSLFINGLDRLSYYVHVCFSVYPARDGQARQFQSRVANSWDRDADFFGYSPREAEFIGPSLPGLHYAVNFNR